MKKQIFMLVRINKMFKRLEDNNLRLYIADFKFRVNTRMARRDFFMRLRTIKTKEHREWV